MVRRPLSNSTWVLAAVVAMLAVIVAAGRGGGSDGALGGGVALIVLVGGAVMIQRIGRARFLMGFNPDGVWVPANGWVGWRQVRHIEVRQTSSALRGRHHTVWVRYVPRDTAPPNLAPADDTATDSAPGDAAPTGQWLNFSPGYRQARTLAMVEEMERCWRATPRPPPLATVTATTDTPPLANGTATTGTPPPATGTQPLAPGTTDTPPLATGTGATDTSPPGTRQADTPPLATDP